MNSLNNSAALGLKVLWHVYRKIRNLVASIMGEFSNSISIDHVKHIRETEKSHDHKRDLSFVKADTVTGSTLPQFIRLTGKSRKQ